MDQPLFVGKEYEETVSLVKKSDGSANYKIWLEGKNCEAFEVSVTDSLTGSTCDGTAEIETTMQEESKVELKVRLFSTEIGEKKAYFMIHPTDGIPLCFSVQANFIGPHIRIVEPSIDFGLLKINTKTKFRLNVENLSDIDAPIVIKNS